MKSFHFGVNTREKRDKYNLNLQKCADQEEGQNENSQACYCWQRLYWLQDVLRSLKNWTFVLILLKMHKVRGRF